MKKTGLLQPPSSKNDSGQERAVGIEIEFGELPLTKASNLVQQFLEQRGMTIEQTAKGRYENLLKGDPAGDWMIEFDYVYLKKVGREERHDDWRDTAEKGLAWVAEAVVPVEIVSPPLPLSQLPAIEALLQKLREAGAKGSSDSIAYAFGMQLNPELPELDAATILAHLQSFLCLYEWLHQQTDPDISRRMSNYIDPFPKEYLSLVLSADYAPSLTELIRDYLEFNPTRNRALDMLPLFRHLNEELVLEYIADASLIKARPTFHYRLPGCELHQTDWGLFAVWNPWVRVEQLASRPHLLAAACADYQQHLDKLFSGFSSEWVTYLTTKVVADLERDSTTLA